ncbi:MAG: methyltransferase type 11 [Actinobacteria bacterium 69-20]|nr:MAG: methyltransferase type 11 [Actinobacteria bacterium 69-20]
MCVEPDRIRDRYRRRPEKDRRYVMLEPATLLAVQERQRAMVRVMRKAGMTDPSTITVLEIGCGAGGNLVEFIRMGFEPANLIGMELVEERAAQARRRLPEATIVISGDAVTEAIEPASRSIVLLSTVFSSVLDDDFQQRLAEVAWNAVAPGGAVVCYDFVVNNPRNRDVRAVPIKRLRTLFPEALMVKRRVTLAPPVARWVTRIHPGLYHVFNAIPWARTHYLTWLAKPPG